MQTIIEIERTGGPNQIRLSRQPIPRPGSGEVLIKVEAVGVAYADVMMREGLYPGVPSRRLTPGYDVVGVIEETGDAACALRCRQRVVALTQTGGYAEYTLAAAALCVPCPTDIPAEEAVAMVLNYITAYQMLTRIARVRPGESLLVHGPAGGVGEALIQFSQLLDCRAYGTVSRRKLTQLQTPLPFVPLHYQEEPFEQQIRQFEPEGVDAVFDPIGGLHLKRSYEALCLGGKVVSYGMSSALTDGRRNLPEAAWQILRSAFLPMRMLAVSKGIHGYGVWRLAKERSDWFRQDMQHILSCYTQGLIKPRIARVLPLSEARQAHELMHAGDLRGKIVLCPQ